MASVSSRYGKLDDICWDVWNPRESASSNSTTVNLCYRSRLLNPNSTVAHEKYGVNQILTSFLLSVKDQVGEATEFLRTTGELG